jgi:hypothetical protein
MRFLSILDLEDDVLAASRSVAFELPELVAPRLATATLPTPAAGEVPSELYA